MSARNLPWIKFFPRDWVSDEKLRLCSLGARGLWLELLCLMHANARRGYLELPDGSPIPPEQIARAIGIEAGEARVMLRELESCGVFSRTESGVIYSRRMAADEAFRAACSAAGRKGGNPTLKGGDKGRVKGVVKGGDKATRVQSTEIKKIVADATPPASEKPTEPKPRPRNDLFDAIADATQSDPAVDGAHVGKTAAALAKASPPFTPAEVREFAARWRELLPWAKPSEHPRLTVGIIAKHITALRAAGRPPDPPRIKRAADNPLVFNPPDAEPWRPGL